ncbi:MAG: hypothetical protein ACO3RV_07005 [Luteolibacter sp.]
MKRTFKLIASRGDEIIFDERIETSTPREARKLLKERLGLQSLSGIVYSITEIPVDLIRQIVDARLVEIAGGAELAAPMPADLEVMLQPIIRRLAALECSIRPETEPVSQRFDPLAEDAADWNLVRRHFRRYGDPHRTAAKYGVELRELNARARREGWSA